MTLANAAIDYYSSAYSTAGKRLMGREVASEGFLQAFLRHGDVERFYCLADSQADFNEFAAACRKWREDRPAVWIPRQEPASLAVPGCLFRGDPLLSKLAWQRRRYGDRAYSLCGVTHTTCTHAVMEALGGLLVEPLYAWDAIVCTSQVVRATAERLLEAWGDYLRNRLGACEPPRVRLPVIPLGVDTAAFDDPHREQTRLAVRRSLGIHAEEFVVLYVGRLAFHAKAHPWQMYLALEQAAERAQKTICLVLAGWFASAEIETAFKVHARALCPRVKMVYIDGNRPEFRRRIWHAADVFLSLADNIQETFGLTPIEAMAAGLPVVVSDWDGYKDTVRHGIDGFRVPTVTPAASAGTELAWRYDRGEDDYDRFIGTASLCAAIDVEQCVAWLVRLAENAALRASLGRSGKQRALSCYDWRHIVRAYQELWQELQNVRRADASPQAPLLPPPHPLRPDPFALFASCPTTQFKDSTVFVRCAAAEQRLTEIYQAPMMNFAAPLFATLDESRRILALLDDAPRSLADLAASGAARDRPRLERTLGWLLKGGVVALDPFPKASDDGSPWASNGGVL